MTGTKTYRVIFQPSGRRGDVAEGTTLLDAARRLGVPIEATCGGRLTCGKCRVEIRSSPENLSPLSAGERELFGEATAGGRVRAACRAEVRGPVTVFVPPESRGQRQVVRKAAGHLAIELKPAVQSYAVDLPPPALDDPRADWERLRDALRAQHDVDLDRIDAALLRTLPGILREGRWQATAYVWMGRELVKVAPGRAEGALGLAIDVGTTTLAAYLCDLRAGWVLATEGMMNPQVSFGDDVMSRITYAMTRPGGTQQLHEMVLAGLNELVSAVTARAGRSPDDVLETVVVGNTSMHHLLLNLNPEHLGVAPFTPVIHGAYDLKACELGLHTYPNGNVHLLPVVAGFLGADLVAGVAAEELHRREGETLLIDIGTNGEMALGNCEGLVAASCATGPAFEGAQIAHGMRAAEGAIEKVEIDPLTWEVRYKVIGAECWSDAGSELPPRGICGSAIIDLGWELFRAGVVTGAGRFVPGDESPRLRDGPQGREFVIAWAEETALERDVVFTADDLQALQLAKAAMYCAVKIMMRRRGIARLDEVILTGAFGTYVDKVKAMAAGLFPDCDLDRVRTVPNAAGDGARICLLNVDRRAGAGALARTIEPLRLTDEPDFDRLFAQAMGFPHAVDAFPHLEERFAEARAARCRRFLQRLPEKLPPDQIVAWAARAEEISYRRRRVIAELGGDTNQIYAVTEGAVDLLSAEGALLDHFPAGVLIDLRRIAEEYPEGSRLVAAARTTRVFRF